MPAQQQDNQEPSIRDYAHVVWRRKWVVAACVLVLVALAIGYSLTRTPLYEASAQLAYETQLDVANPLAIGGYVDPTQRQSQLDSVVSMVASPELIDRANSLLGSAAAAADYSVSAQAVTAPGQTTSNVVSITAVGPDPRIAARVANKYAEAVMELRRELQVEQVKKAEQVVRDKLDTYQSATARLSADYVTLQQRLSDLQILEATATGNFRLIIPAVAPDQPFSPRPVRNALMGAILGLVVGIGIALILEQFDTRVRTEEAAASILGLSLLGQIHKRSPRAARDEPLVVLGEPRSPEAEAYRKLRGNLEFSNVDGDLKSMLFTSSLQHEGKSLTACNLALSLSTLGQRVVLVDADLRLPQAHHYLGLRNAVGVSTVLTGRTPVAMAVQKRPTGPSLYTFEEGPGRVRTEADNVLHVLTSGPVPPNPGEIVASRSFAHLIEELESDFDTVIIDGPAMLAVGDCAAIAPRVDGIVFVVDLARVRRPILVTAAAELERMPCRKVGLVVISKTARPGYANSYYHHAEETETPLRTMTGTRRQEPVPIGAVEKRTEEGQ